MQVPCSAYLPAWAHIPFWNLCTPFIRHGSTPISFLLLMFRVSLPATDMWPNIYADPSKSGLHTFLHLSYYLLTKFTMAFHSCCDAVQNNHQGSLYWPLLAHTKHATTSSSMWRRRESESISTIKNSKSNSPQRHVLPKIWNNKTFEAKFAPWPSQPTG